MSSQEIAPRRFVVVSGGGHEIEMKREAVVLVSGDWKAEAEAEILIFVDHHFSDQRLKIRSF